MSRLVVVSNRVALPREVRAGGLAVAMDAALRETGGLWFGWSGRAVDGEPGPVQIQTDGPVTYATVDLAKADYDAYYNGFANRTLWPLLHYRPDLVDYRRDTYRAYQRVNRWFARSLAPLIKDDDLVWVHDYHLIPLAAVLREEGVTARLGFFLHTPLPTPDLVSVLPGHRALMDALTEYDLVGFHTASYRQAFTDYLRDFADAQLLDEGVAVTSSGHGVKTTVLPIGIDTDGIASLAARASSQPSVRRLAESLQGRWLVVGVDRLDYSKGLAERFRAFGRLLERYPEHRRDVSMLQVATATRGEVPEYRAIRAELERYSGAVNGRFAEADWVPLRYVNRTYPHTTLTGFYRIAQIGLVTPLRDGMNLVAKEYVAAQDPEGPGVLILSTFAGAARELGSALIVNPYDVEGVADALHRAVTMPLKERKRRWSEMMQVLHDWTIDDWRTTFVETLAATRRQTRRKSSRSQAV